MPGGVPADPLPPHGGHRAARTLLEPSGGPHHPVLQPHHPKAHHHSLSVSCPRSVGASSHDAQRDFLAQKQATARSSQRQRATLVPNRTCRLIYPSQAQRKSSFKKMSSMEGDGSALVVSGGVIGHSVGARLAGVAVG